MSKTMSFIGERLQTPVGLGLFPGIAESPISGESTTLIVPLAVTGSQFAPNVEIV